MLSEEYAQPATDIMEEALNASRVCGNKSGIVPASERSRIQREQSAAVEYGLAAYPVGHETDHNSRFEIEGLDPRTVSLPAAESILEFNNSGPQYPSGDRYPSSKRTKITLIEG
ncbi:hypothetical protein BJ170DRAFT_625375 [Xylariales sp. AK1849]|nr:hypothetical protein BJ170DRAFT_625375 [Xylariales sp. AK1849]